MKTFVFAIVGFSLSKANLQHVGQSLSKSNPADKILTSAPAVLIYLTGSRRRPYLVESRYR